MNKSHKFFAYWFPILFYCLLIFVQSSHPSPKLGPDWPFKDKLLHFTAYALLGALFLRAFNTTSIRHHLKLIFILSVLLSSLYDISDEIHQSFVPFRTADAMDALADILGSAFGAGIYLVWSCRHWMNIPESESILFFRIPPLKQMPFNGQKQ